VVGNERARLFAREMAAQNIQLASEGALFLFA
jgi:hypothetical protein